MDTPDTHPSMLVFKAKINTLDLAVPVVTVGEAASYLIGMLWPLTDSTQPLRPHIEPFKDHYGNTVGQWQVQDGKQPFPE